MSNLEARTESAKANAHGFVADEVVTYDIAREYKAKGCTFFLRLIDLDNLKYDKTPVTDRELHSAMTHSAGGSGLSFMPLVQAKSDDPVKDLSSFATRMEQLGMPINITMWLDEESLKNIFGTQIENLKSYKKIWTEQVIKAGYSAGYYYGGVPEEGCSCDTSDTNNSVLSVVECSSLSNSSLFKTITIGDNTGTCKIRWAYLGTSS